MFSLVGKTAVVTGASGGIGTEIAKVLYAQGASLIISGTRSDNLKRLAEELGERASFLTCNLKDKDEVAGFFEQANSLLGKVDILVCNAGITKDNLAIRMKDEDFLEVINLNLTSTFVLNRAAIKQMIKNKWGRIINIASIVGVTGNPGQANYAASKAGMIAMSKSIAAEVANRNITVNCIAPGFIQTSMTDILTEDQKDKLLRKIPKGELGKAEDVANLVAFLASNESGYITGQTMHVNGGMLMV